ncbi:hypothetical protein ACROYT_G015184, partial [Oculina patagonica]
RKEKRDDLAYLLFARTVELKCATKRSAYLQVTYKVNFTTCNRGMYKCGRLPYSICTGKFHGIFDVTNSANTRKIAWVLAWMYPELRDQCHVGVAKTFESARKVDKFCSKFKFCMDSIV